MDEERRTEGEEREQTCSKAKQWDGYRVKVGGGRYWEVLCVEPVYRRVLAHRYGRCVRTRFRGSPRCILGTNHLGTSNPCSYMLVINLAFFAYSS